MLELSNSFKNLSYSLKAEATLENLTFVMSNNSKISQGTRVLSCKMKHFQ